MLGCKKGSCRIGNDKLVVDLKQCLCFVVWLCNDVSDNGYSKQMVITVSLFSEHLEWQSHFYFRQLKGNVQSLSLSYNSSRQYRWSFTNVNEGLLWQTDTPKSEDAFC